MLSQIIAMVLDDVLMMRYLIEKAGNGSQVSAGGLTGVEIKDHQQWQCNIKHK